MSPTSHPSVRSFFAAALGALTLTLSAAGLAALSTGLAGCSGSGRLSGTDATSAGGSSGSGGSSSSGSSGGSSGGSSSSGASGGRTACGNGTVEPGEQCDDGNKVLGDGCSSDCRLEEGWKCPTAGQPCSRTTCGDGVKQGTEQCDDGNTLPFDGCSADCKVELDCTQGECTAFCGDGLVEAGEACDDGNSLDGDGCSGTCTLEAGSWSCEEQTASLPDRMSVTVVFRDFRGRTEPVPACPTGLGPFPALLATGCAHPDFEYDAGGLRPNEVQSTLAPSASRPHVLMPALDTAASPYVTSVDTFAQWYVNVPGVNRTILGKLDLARVAGTNTYVTTGSASTSVFFPLDALPTTYPCPTGQQCGWGVTTYTVGTGNEHDFGFTTELRTQFTFQGGEVLNFTGDDDVWVYIAGKLVVDLGGIHPPVAKAVTLDDATATRLGLVKGRIYEMALFHAERHLDRSTFRLTLAGFLKNTTVCGSSCGDGIVQQGEGCDLGAENGKGKGCSETCRLQDEF